MADNGASKWFCSVLLKAPDSVVSQWRKLTLRTIDFGWLGWIEGNWKIELPGKGKGAQISFTPTSLIEPEDTLLKEIESAIQEVIQKMEVGEGMAKMSRADIEELAKVVTRARTSLQSREGLV